MSYETFQQGPAVYIPLLLISLLVTLVAYGAFPLIFARVRKTGITKKKYNLICFGVNFLIMILFIALNGSSSGAPYVLWTWVFSAAGLKTLESNGVLERPQDKNGQKSCPDQTVQINETPGHSEATETVEVPEAPLFSEKKPKIRFCRKCGFELIEGSKFCSKCGAKVTEE